MSKIRTPFYERLNAGRPLRTAGSFDLSFIPDESCDAVLMLGPFYNLSLPEDRHKAAAEARRILRKGGLIFAAGINYMTMLNWGFSDWPEHILESWKWIGEYTRTGDLPSNTVDVPIWHMTTAAEFRSDLRGFQEIVLAGVESFARGREENLLKLTHEQAATWLDLIEETGRTPEGLGMTGHFLYIGKK